MKYWEIIASDRQVRLVKVFKRFFLSASNVQGQAYRLGKTPKVKRERDIFISLAQCSLRF